MRDIHQCEHRCQFAAVVRVDDDVANAVTDQVRDPVLEDGNPADRQHRLGTLRAQRPESRRQARTQEHRAHCAIMAPRIRSCRCPNPQLVQLVSDPYLRRVRVGPLDRSDLALAELVLADACAFDRATEVADEKLFGRGGLVFLDADGVPVPAAVTAVPAIAVVDSGIDASRLDFTGRVRAQVNLASLTPNSPGDGRGHGTFVAGVAAGAISGLAGAAPSAPIVSLDVANDAGQARVSDVIAAADWILANKTAHNIRVANFSLGAAAGGRPRRAAHALRHVRAAGRLRGGAAVPRLQRRRAGQAPVQLAARASPSPRRFAA